MDTIFRNVRCVTPFAVMESGFVTVRDGRIVSLLPEGPRAGRHADQVVVDGHDRLLLPGLIDLHNDGIEQEIEPRPRAVFPLSIALRSLESQLVSHGITTIFHSFSFMDGREGTLDPQILEPTVRELNRQRRTGIIRHLVHARYEMAEVHHVDRFRRLIEGGFVNLASFMDHTPGQGQYRNPEYLVNYYARKYHAAREDVEAIMRERLAKAGSPAVDAALSTLSACARAAGIPVASHDDDSPQKVARMHSLGVTISEFPVELSAARAALSSGMHVAVGAPNLLRGGSTTNNLSAMEAVRADCADILCSDYYSPALLNAVFKLAREGALPLADAVRMATLNPARAAGLDGVLGSLEAGKRADLILVNDDGELPSVVEAWVGGRRVYQRHDGEREGTGTQWAAEVSGPGKETAHA